MAMLSKNSFGILFEKGRQLPVGPGAAYYQTVSLATFSWVDPSTLDEAEPAPTPDLPGLRCKAAGTQKRRFFAEAWSNTCECKPSEKNPPQRWGKW